MSSEMEQLKTRKEELQQLLSQPEIFSDPQKIKELVIELGKIEKEIKELGTTSTPSAGQEKLIMEIRAGAGGDEAALFAGSLLHMYTAYAKKRGWDVNLIDSNPTTLGGYKEIIFEITGKDTYKELRHEAGVHRIQRIPETEKNGRIHTSTASVAILKEATETEIEIKPQDVKVEFFRSSGPGGQNVNKVETAVRIYHLPSGLVVTSQESRSQQKNRAGAMTLLRSRLLDAKTQEEAKKKSLERKQQIGTGDRSEKIRTYNFPQDRVTDHRIKESWHNIESIMEGNIDSIIEGFGDSKSSTNKNEE